MSEQEQREVPAATPVTPGVWLLPSQGNGLAVETPGGVITIDTGPGGRKTNDEAAKQNRQGNFVQSPRVEARRRTPTRRRCGQC